MAINWSKLKPLELDWLSEELKKVLDEHRILLYSDSSFCSKDASIMYAIHCRGEIIGMICMNTLDVYCIGLTHDEIEAVIWHEVAHLLFHASEKEADDYAVAHTSRAVWVSAIKKSTYLTVEFTGYKGEYAHRNEWLPQ